MRGNVPTKRSNHHHHHHHHRTIPSAHTRLFRVRSCAAVVVCAHASAHSTHTHTNAHEYVCVCKRASEGERAHHAILACACACVCVCNDVFVFGRRRRTHHYFIETLESACDANAPLTKQRIISQFAAYARRRICTVRSDGGANPAGPAAPIN